MVERVKLPCGCIRGVNPDSWEPCKDHQGLHDKLVTADKHLKAMESMHSGKSGFQENYGDQIYRLARFIVEELPGGNNALADGVTAVDLAIKLLRERVVAADVPIFVIEATDSLAAFAVEAYQDLCIARQLMDQSKEVSSALREIVIWQEENPTRVKDPEHKHVPVTIEPGHIKPKAPDEDRG